MATAQVYLPLRVTIDHTTGRLLENPIVDFDGAPWTYVGEAANIWKEVTLLTSGQGVSEVEWNRNAWIGGQELDWFCDERIEAQAMDAVMEDYNSRVETS